MPGDETASGNSIPGKPAMVKAAISAGPTIACSIGPDPGLPPCSLPASSPAHPSTLHTAILADDHAHAFSARLETS